jgi:hypothetical protein
VSFAGACLATPIERNCSITSTPLQLARRTTGSGRHTPGHNHHGFHPRNGLFTLVLILGGIWRLQRQHKITREGAADMQRKARQPTWSRGRVVPPLFAEQKACAIRLNGGCSYSGRPKRLSCACGLISDHGSCPGEKKPRAASLKRLLSIKASCAISICRCGEAARCDSQSV